MDSINRGEGQKNLETSFHTKIFPDIEMGLGLGQKIFYSTDCAHLVEGTPRGTLCQDFLECLRPFVGGDGEKAAPFRKQIIIKSISLLAVFFPEEREIRLYTGRMGRELFLIENATHIPGSFEKYIKKGLLIEINKSPSTWQEISWRQQGIISSDRKKDSALQSKTEIITKKILAGIHAYRPTWFERMTDYGLGPISDYVLLRVHLLKFLAILPSLDYDLKGDEVKRILLEAGSRLLADSKLAHHNNVKGEGRGLSLPLVFVIYFFFFICKLLPQKFLAYGIRTLVKMMAKRFIAGESIQKAHHSLQALFATDRDVTLDQLGELVVSEKEADHYCDEVIKLIRGFSLHVKKGSCNKVGIPKAHVSIKVSALTSDFRPYARESTFLKVAPRLKKILLEARAEGVFINIDAEHYHYRDLVFWIYKKVLREARELKKFSFTGIVLQAYLRDSYTHLEELIAFAKERDLTMPIRIVKGAYWDAETIEGDALGFDAPQFLNKEETDLNFRQLTEVILMNSPHVQLCLASHNFSDHAFAIALKELKYGEALGIEHQCLHMTYEGLSNALAQMGLGVRNYVPVGSLLVGMAYLVRRIMENSSQVGVLAIMRSHKIGSKIRPPKDVHLEKLKRGFLKRDQSIVALTADFFNVTPLRPYKEEEIKWMEEALEKFQKTSLGLEYRHRFSDDAVASGPVRHIYSCSDPKLLVGRIQFVDIGCVERAVELSCECFNSGGLGLGTSSWFERSALLIKCADRLLMARNDFAALIMHEAGKAMLEAQADVDEAIDFLNFYAREEKRLQKNNLSLKSRGVVAVIAPWNFPLAIPCGMMAAALVAGNTVILKSAEQTPLVVQKLVDLCHGAGIPQDALIHLPGEGETVGQELVKHPKVAGIVFTGSKSVGLKIAHQAGQRIVENRPERLRYPVKVITEMGGKNGIIVTANAELDETVAGILYSAFAHAGQKCSAASRIIVDEKIRAILIRRLRSACKDLKVGPSDDFSVAINPVISKEDCERLKEQIKLATSEAYGYGGEVIIDRSQEKLPGFCVGPVIIQLPPARAKHEDSFAMKELFGPVLHIIPFDGGLGQALEIFNQTDYALTGGIFSQSQDDIDFLGRKMQAGNIYINRSITGARVGIEPFGGFKLSGTGPKAGGKSYLKAFHLNSVLLPKERDLVARTPDEEVGGGYQFDLCPPSSQSQKERLRSMDQALEYILQNFEVLFQGIYTLEKEHLRNYKDWLKRHSSLFFKKESLNLTIPGQLNYNDFSLNEKSLLIVGYERRCYFATLMDCIAALSLGLGVTVATRNQVATDWWNQFRGHFIRANISAESFDVYFSTADFVGQVLQRPYLKSIVVDGNLQNVENILGQVYGGEPWGGSRVTKTVKTPFDAYAPQNFKRLLEQFTHVRSFAVNIMRHGAPMELDIM